MRLSFVLAVVAALTASISAASIPATAPESGHCPFMCFNDKPCRTCDMVGMARMLIRTSSLNEELQVESVQF
ncbi:uncharacterized protein EDB91DRAFT_1136345, partial [Suillus paluster]|uniref:uncharacterized protein n=1 Tax=Suillus paluster TaxID=48578 RepID=UPI001B8726C1